MTNRYLNSGYYAGYTLGAQYTGLIIGSTATVGGAGVVANHPATITNFGQIHGSGTAGVLLADGGTVTDGSASDTTALISGYRRGVSCAGPAGAISNFATITSTYNGVFLARGWSLTNGSSRDHAALVTGRGGVYAYDGADTVTNFATITGRFWGVVLGAGGTFTNGSASDSAALVEGNAGVVVYDGASTVTNFGTIDGGAGLSVHFDFAGGRLVAEAGSVFLGLAWVGGSNVDVVSGLATFAGGINTYGKITGAGTLALTGGTTDFSAGTRLNVAVIEQTGASTRVDVFASLLDARRWTQAAGVITVNAGDRLTFKGGGDIFGGTLAGAGEVAFTGGSDTLDGTMLTVSEVFIGGATVTFAGKVADTGMIAQTSAVTLGGSTAASVTIASGASWRIEGDAGIASGPSGNSTITVDGALIKSAGTGVSGVGVGITDDGSIEAASGMLNLMAGVAGGGTLKIDAGATLELGGAVARTITATFGGSGAALDLAAPMKMGAKIAGFTVGDTIDLLNVTATSAALNKLDQLIVLDGTTRVSTLQLSGDYHGATFSLTSDGRGGTSVTVTGGGTAAFAQAMAGVAGGAHAALVAHAIAAIDTTPAPLVSPGAR